MGKSLVLYLFLTQELSDAAADFVRRMRSEERLALEDIVILTVSTLERSAFAGLTSLAGIPLSAQPESGKLWFTTVRRYKGLEAKAVLLVDVCVSQLAHPTCQRLIYVGRSRAAAYLETILLDDISAEEYPTLVKKLGVDAAPSPQGIANWLGMECRME